MAYCTPNLHSDLLRCIVEISVPPHEQKVSACVNDKWTLLSGRGYNFQKHLLTEEHCLLSGCLCCLHCALQDRCFGTPHSPPPAYICQMWWWGCSRSIPPSSCSRDQFLICLKAAIEQLPCHSSGFGKNTSTNRWVDVLKCNQKQYRHTIGYAYKHICLG